VGRGAGSSAAGAGCAMATATVERRAVPQVRPKEADPSWREQWVPPFRQRRKGQQLPQPLTMLEDVGRGSDINLGFVFLKPHANIESVVKFVRERLSEARVRVVDEGSVTAEEILESRIIDVHYGSLAAKALDQQPQDHAVQPDAECRFQEAFDLSWQEALGRGLVCNATEAMRRLGCDAEELDVRWTPLQIGQGKVKMGGGFYCGHIGGLYVVNGFYMAMRSVYTTPGRSVTWFGVEWSSSDLRWEDFRTELLGNTDPSQASRSSLRGAVHSRWRELGLPDEPQVGDNVVHASASPFEALLERSNWAGVPLSQDPFGRALLDQGVSEATLRQWATDPIVNHDGKRTSLFDLFEHLDSEDCVEVALAIHEDA